jgi:hypothetical protein
MAGTQLLGKIRVIVTVGFKEFPKPPENASSSAGKIGHAKVRQ